MFLAISEYLRPVEDLDAVRPEHLAYVTELIEQGRLVSAGRQVPPTGGVLVMRGADRDEIDAVIARDPYVVHGVARYAVTQFGAVLGDVKD